VDHQTNQHHDEIFAHLKVLIMNMVTQGNQKSKKTLHFLAQMLTLDTFVELNI
jgi:hypothetical protein